MNLIKYAIMAIMLSLAARSASSETLTGFNAYDLLLLEPKTYEVTGTFDTYEVYLNFGGIYNFTRLRIGQYAQLRNMLIGSINNFRELKINYGGSLTNDGTVINHDLLINNGGFLTNINTLTNNDTLLSYSRFRNFDRAVITNNATLRSFDVLTNLSGGTLNNTSGALLENGTDGSLENHGALNNNEGATLANNATLINDGTLSNNGSLTNSKQLDNNGVLDNYRSLLMPGAAHWISILIAH